MIKVLALDIALNRTGWAVGTADGAPPSWGVFETVNWDGNEGQNLADFEQLLRSFGGLTHLVYEHIFVNVKNGGKQFQFNGTDGQISLKAIALLHCHHQKIAIRKVAIDDWRKRFLGLNRRPKDAPRDEGYWKRLALHAAARRNWFCEHHDSAEALGIMDYSLAALSKDYKLRTNPIHGRQLADQMFRRGAHA